MVFKNIEKELVMRKLVGDEIGVGKIGKMEKEMKENEILKKIIELKIKDDRKERRKEGEGREKKEVIEGIKIVIKKSEERIIGKNDMIEIFKMMEFWGKREVRKIDREELKEVLIKDRWDWIGEGKRI